MPAANERALEKAKGIPADAIIFDLEDAVSPDAKDLARAQAIAAVNSGEYGKRELTISCNALATPWGHADVAAAAKACVSAVVIPKINSVAEVSILSRTLQDTHAWLLDGGTGELSAGARQVGTTVTVHELFFTTPARRKFLKTDATELAHCIEAVRRHALARPWVTFAIWHDGKLV